MSKTSKTLCIIGSILLLVMAGFHGSGFFYIRDRILASDADAFLKDIVPVLFAHPSIHLIGLSAFGFLAIFMAQPVRLMLFLLALVILADAILAFALGGYLPGGLLVAAALCFVIAGFNTAFAPKK